MSRATSPAFVVLVFEPGEQTPAVHGPYSHDVADREAERLRASLRREGLTETGTPGEYRVTFCSLGRGPIPVRSYR